MNSGLTHYNAPLFTLSYLSQPQTHSPLVMLMVKVSKTYVNFFLIFMTFFLSSGSNYGFRPVNRGAGGDGISFSQALGGNYQREQFTSKKRLTLNTFFCYHLHGWETAGFSRHAGQSNFPRIVCRPIRLA